MKALVVYTYEDHCGNDYKIDINNCVKEFKSNRPTISEILNIQESLSSWPRRVCPRVVNIIELEE